jgi:hypothetical protein
LRASELGAYPYVDIAATTVPISWMFKQDVAMEEAWGRKSFLTSIREMSVMECSFHYFSKYNVKNCGE